MGSCIWKKAVPALTRALAREADLSDDDDGAPVGVGRECVVKESANRGQVGPLHRLLELDTALDTCITLVSVHVS